ncbi:hypothetical protein [Falsiroseomonas ponticola]|uniref:hypothetical protein n=1 Tax=Falsiroseomonas ponticola TaxID=2786951 RepID=UPI001933ACC6|nr:hypothetical protein [Roseomonas ponticola]
MIRRPTVFVVGAGASSEFGLPVGFELKQRITRALAIRTDAGRVQSGSEPILAAFRRAVRLKDGRLGDLNPLVAAAKKIVAGMPQAISIDNYIDAHGGDVDIELAGKIAIAVELLGAEASSKLTATEVEKDSWGDPIRKHINFSNVEHTWLGVLQKILFENAKKSDISRIFENVSFIVFNYDRCIEHFLHQAVTNYFWIPSKDAAQVVARIPIYHVYGAIGRLAWQSGELPEIGYGASADESKILAAARKIKTFTEGLADQALSEGIKMAVRRAENLLFLGCAFHPKNIEFLRDSGNARGVDVMGTAVGLSAPNIEMISDMLYDILEGNSGRSPILRPDLKCAGLLSEYSRRLS